MIGAAHHDADITVFVLDNSTTAMTGGQESFTCGERLLEVLRGLGVSSEHLHVIDPRPQKHAQNVELIRREIEHHGLSVIVPKRACVQFQPTKHQRVVATVGGQRCACEGVGV